MLEFSWASTWATLKTNLQLPANACHSLWPPAAPNCRAGGDSSLCAPLYFLERARLFSLSHRSPEELRSRSLCLEVMILCHVLSETFWFHWSYGTCVYLSPKLFYYKCSVSHTLIDVCNSLFLALCWQNKTSENKFLSLSYMLFRELQTKLILTLSEWRLYWYASGSPRRSGSKTMSKKAPTILMSLGLTWKTHHLAIKAFQ